MAPHMPKRLAVFGAYSDHDLYQRNRILVNILEKMSLTSVRIRPDIRSTGHGFSSGKTALGRLREMFSNSRSLWSQRSLLADCDVIFIPYPAYLDILLLWLSGSLAEKCVIADAFLELHSTVVDDRGLFPAKSLRARLLKAFQRFTLGKADIVLIDTPQQAAALRQMLRGSKAMVADVPVGIDEAVWSELSCPALTEPVQLLFWGTFIPLHGIEHIISAARILKARGVAVELRLIGDGQVASSIESELAHKPLGLLTWQRCLVDTQELRAAIARAHIVLGIFGDSAKAASVVPYKVHQALASGRPTITRSSAATEPLGDAERGLILCAPADATALATAIEQTIARLHKGWRPDSRWVYEQQLSNRVIEGKLAAAMELRAVGHPNHASPRP